MNSEDTPACTSSQELPGGTTPSPLPDLTQGDLFGPRHALANPSAPPAKAKRKKTSGTSGRFSPPSSASASLTASLGNRLQALLDTNGSTEYVQTWKRKATPSGLRIFRLAARARLTSDRGCSGSLQGWPTATTNDHKNAPYQQKDGNRFLTLPGAALEAAGWPTPTTEAGDGGAQTNPAKAMERLASGRSNLDDAAHLSGWQTPTQTDYKHCEHRDRIKGEPLRGQANLGATAPPWIPCPCCENHYCTVHQTHAHECPCPEVSEWATSPYAPQGTTVPSSPAGTARRVVSRLNPGFSLWLMGYPVTWASSSPGWSDWDTTERLLALYYAGLEGTAPPDSREPVTP